MVVIALILLSCATVRNQTVNNKTVELKFIMHYTSGDIDLHIVDSIGRYVGENYGPEGSIDKPTIPNSTYSKSSDMTIITIENPSSEIYTMRAHATQTYREASFSILVIESRETIF